MNCGSRTIIKKLEAENPHGAAELTRIRENSDIRAVAAVLRDTEARGGIAAVQHLVDRKVEQGNTPGEIRLASLAVNPNLLPDGPSREEFLSAHVSALQLLDHDETGVTTSAYLDRLERAAGAPDSWRVAKSNPMGMLVSDHVSTPSLREYYEQEQEWLDPVIVDVTSRSLMNDEGKGAQISDVVSVAYDNRPYFKQAVTEQRLNGAAFFLFGRYGDAISRTSSEAGGVPLGEVLEVIYANNDFLERFKDDTPDVLAGRLVTIYNNKPAVWRAARRMSLALRMNEDAPQVADKLFEKYTADDIAAMLYAGYENELVFAAEAVAKFGDLAIYILSHYEESRRFHEALKVNSVGVRLIP